MWVKLGWIKFWHLYFILRFTNKRPNWMVSEWIERPHDLWMICNDTQVKPYEMELRLDTIMLFFSWLASHVLSWYSSKEGTGVGRSQTLMVFTAGLFKLLRRLFNFKYSSLDVVLPLPVTRKRQLLTQTSRSTFSKLMPPKLISAIEDTVRHLLKFITQ